MLNKYGDWKLLYEDQHQCFSKALDLETENEVLIITHFDSSSLSRPVKLLLPETLIHFIDNFEDDHGYHIILKNIKGKSLKTYLKQAQLSYQERVKMCYDWIKSLHRYDQFPDSLKIQLVDYEQIVVNDDLFTSREWIDYASKDDVDYIQLFKQLGETIEIILPDAPAHQSQFIDTLRIGKHDYFSLGVFRKKFKDVFLYEKKEVLDQIPFEYDIIINDLSAGPPITLNVTPPKKDLHEVPVEVEDEEAPLGETPVVEDKTVEEEDNTVLEDDYPENLPKRDIVRTMDDEESYFDGEMEEIFDDEDQAYKWQVKWKETLLVACVSLAIISFLIWGGYKLLTLNQEVNVSFEIETMAIDNRVAFMNTSTGDKKIESFLWEIYYADRLIQSFEDTHLFPLFETHGEYTIVLRAKDKKGNWLEPYSQTYEYRN